MLKLSWLEFVVRTIPEGFLMVLAAHAFSKTKINIKKYFLSSVIFIIMVYLIRLLPIQYGINSILSLIVLIVSMNLINKTDIIKSISAGIIPFILGFLFEGLSIFFMQSVLKMDVNTLMLNGVSRTLVGLPSLGLYAVFVVIYYIILSKQNKLR